MSVRRRHKKHPLDTHQAENTTKPSADPFATSTEEKPSLIWQIGKFLEDTFSHKGVFWLGVAIATVCFITNFYFWLTFFTNLTDYAPWQCLILGSLVSAGTTIFELVPVVMNRGRRSLLHQIFLAASKPANLPELNPKVSGDADELVRQYRNSDRGTRNFFETARWIAIGIESAVGFIFMGRIGSGIGALIRLCVFLGSIFGTEFGVTLALRAKDWELPAQIRKQLDDVIANAGNLLKLKQL